MAPKPVPTVDGRETALRLLAERDPVNFRGLIRSYQISYGALFHRAGQAYPLEQLITDIITVEKRQGLLFDKVASCTKCGKSFGTNVNEVVCQRCLHTERAKQIAMNTVHLEVRYGTQMKRTRACMGYRLLYEGKKTTNLNEVTCRLCVDFVEQQRVANNERIRKNEAKLLKEKTRLHRESLDKIVPRDVRRAQLKEMPYEEVVAAGRKAVELLGHKVSDEWEPESLEYVIRCEVVLKLVHDYDFECLGCGKPSNHSKVISWPIPVCLECAPYLMKAECTQEFWSIILDACLEHGVFNESRRDYETKMAWKEKQREQTK